MFSFYFASRTTRPVWLSFPCFHFITCLFFCISRSLPMRMPQGSVYILVLHLCFLMNYSNFIFFHLQTGSLQISLFMYLHLFSHLNTFAYMCTCKNVEHGVRQRTLFLPSNLTSVEVKSLCSPNHLAST